MGTDGTIYTTDNKNEAGTYFYYLAEGQERWKTYRNGGDGCFGADQGASVKGFKGFMAFPVSDFVSADGTALTSATQVKEMYMFFDYSDVSLLGKGFISTRSALFPSSEFLILKLPSGLKGPRRLFFRFLPLQKRQRPCNRVINRFLRRI